MHQMSVLRLAEDMLLAPAPKLALEPGGSKGLLEKWIRPTPGKLLTAGSVALLSLGSMVWGFFSAPAEAVAAAPAAAAGLTDAAAVTLATAASGPGSWIGGGGSQMASLLTDPWLNGIQLLLAAAYLYWGWKERRG
jgi:hypothetical protein